MRLRTSRVVLPALTLSLLLAACAPAQPTAYDPPQDIPQAAAGKPVDTHAEPPLDGLVRLDGDTIALTLGADRKLLLHDFDFNGEPVTSDKIHLRLLSPGVYELSSVAWTVGYWHFEVADRGSFFGLGARGDTLDHAGTTVRNLALETAAPVGSTTSQPVPFLLSNDGYGLWLDTGGEATFDLNTSDPSQVVVDAPLSRLRIVLFTGADGSGRFPAILASFTALAGHGSADTLPPLWAFAPWHTVGGTQQEVIAAAEHLRSQRLPGSVLLLPPGWAVAGEPFRFDAAAFPDPAAMVAHLHRLGFELALSLSAWLTEPPELTGPPGPAEPQAPADIASTVREAAEQGLFVRAPDGTPWTRSRGKLRQAMLDFTNPNTRRWWAEHLRELLATGVNGFALADSEASFPGRSGQDPVLYHDHTDPRLMRNLAPTLFATAAQDVLTHSNGGGALLVDSVSTGGPAPGFARGSTGTAQALPARLRSALSASLSGSALLDPVPAAAEDDPPLYARAVELAAYTPLMTLPAPTGNAPEELDLYRRYAALSLSLAPYRYALARQASETGMPAMRPLVLEAQGDPTARAIEDEYLFGPGLLVAPVLDRSTSRLVSLPAGDWLELATGKPTQGPALLQVSAPLDGIPVFARAGTILPLLPDDLVTLAPVAEANRKTIAGPDNRRRYDLLGATKTPVTITDFEGRVLTRTLNSLTIALPATHTTVSILLHWRFEHPQTVSVNGTSLATRSEPGGGSSIAFDCDRDTTVEWK